MKKIKFIAILLFLLAFISGSGFSNYSVEPIIFEHQVNSLPSEKTVFSSKAFDYKKEAGVSIIKKKIKHRATTSENSTLRVPYFTKLVQFKIFKNSLIYGIATVYQIQRHNYLHLYQLF